jgi:hypothetical protein
MSGTADGGLVFTDRAHRGRSGGGIAVRRGVRVDAAWWRGIPPWERYRLRVEAASHALADPVFALESAAVLHGLPIFGEPAHIHVLAPTGSRGYRSGDVIRHLRTAEADIVRVEGVRLTSVEDTVLALLRVLPIALAVAVADAAVRRGVSVEVLRDRLERQTDRRGRARASAALDLADGRSESVLESLSRVVIAHLGYPDPELQVDISLSSGRARVDFLWRSERVVGEADGRGKYFGEGVRTDDAVHAERRREIELRRVVRDVARWEWADVVTPGRLDAILRAAGLRRIRPIDPRLAAALDDRRSIRPA